MDIEAVRRTAVPIVASRGHGFGLSLEDREDLLQDVLVKYLHTWPDDTEPDNVAAWLETVAARTITDRWRAVERRPKAANVRATDEDAYDVVADLMEKTKSRQASSPAISALLRDEIFSLISDEEAQLLRLRFVEDMSAAEVAAELGITGSNVDQRVTRAKKKLRTALAQRPDLVDELRTSHPRLYSGG